MPYLGIICSLIVAAQSNCSRHKASVGHHWASERACIKDTTDRAYV